MKYSNLKSGCRRLLAAVFAAMICLSADAFALSRDALRAAWQEIAALRTQENPYLEKPEIRAYSSGTITEEKQRDALNCLNFLRAAAGLEAVSISPLYTLRAQNGALLLAANDQLDHQAPQPEDMPDELYASAHLGTSLGNIAKFNWMKPDLLVDGVCYFARDDGEQNLHALGHRRWLLNPCMAETGFGLANSESGMSYVCMYAVDAGNADAQWDFVAWPSAQAFPVEMMRSQLAWSVSLNEDIYDLAASRPQVLLIEERSGAEFHFDIARATGDGSCLLSTEGYGSGGCIIFRPEIEAAGIAEYEQNQIWQVQIRGLKRTDGSDAEISYRCEMVSLYPQDVANIELSQLEAELAVGETLWLQADVVPAYADDLNIIWGSDAPTVARVDAQGRVTAIAAGTCTITAMSANGRKDACRVEVK